MTKSTSMESTIREEYEEAHKIAKAMRELMDCEGWKILMEVARTQIEVRGAANSTPMAGLEDVFSRQLCSGEVLGIRLLVATPESMLEEAQSTIDSLKEKIGNE